MNDISDLINFLKANYGGNNNNIDQLNVFYSNNGGNVVRLWLPADAYDAIQQAFPNLKML